MKHRLESRSLAEMSIPQICNDTTLMAESKDLKSFLMIAKEESEKVGLKVSI